VIVVNVPFTGLTGSKPRPAVIVSAATFHRSRRIDFCSRRLKVSRSRLLADAARESLARQRAPFDATAAWNEVIAEAGQPGDDPAALALRRRSKLTLGAARAKRR